MSQHGAMPAAWEETSFTGGPQGAGGHLDCPGLRQCAVRPDAVPGFQKMCRVLDTPFSTISTQRGPQKTCGVAALHRHVRVTSVTSCFKSSSEMSPGARGASPGRARRRQQCTRTAHAWRGRWRCWPSDMCMHMCMCMYACTCATCWRAPRGPTSDLLYSLLYIPLYRKLLYKAENRCIRRYTRTRVASRPSIAIQLYLSYTALYSAVQRCS